MAEADIDPDDRRVTLRDLRNNERDLLGAIDRLTRASEGDGWIPCSERLPKVIRVSDECEQSAYVLVYAHKTAEHEFNVGKAFLMVHAELNGGEPRWRGDFGQSVTHWQPLPAPPSTDHNT